MDSHITGKQMLYKLDPRVQHIYDVYGSTINELQKSPFNLTNIKYNIYGKAYYRGYEIAMYNKYNHKYYIKLVYNTEGTLREVVAELHGIAYMPMLWLPALYYSTMGWTIGGATSLDHLATFHQKCRGSLIESHKQTFKSEDNIFQPVHHIKPIEQKQTKKASIKVNEPHTHSVSYLTTGLCKNCFEVYEVFQETEGSIIEKAIHVLKHCGGTRHDIIRMLDKIDRLDLATDMDASDLVGLL